MKSENIAEDGLSAIDLIESTTTLEETLTVFKAYISIHGFTSVAICQLVNPMLIDLKNPPVFITDWSDEWREHWWSNDYMQHDPIIQFLLKSRKPFSWSTAYQYASRFGKKIMDSSHEHDFHDGIAFPITTGVGPMGCVSLGADEVPFDPQILAMVEIVSINCYMHMVKLRGGGQEHVTTKLSKRENEIMHYVAEGKTNWEIAKVLELTENTIKEYLKNVACKLNTVNRAHAVSTAIRSGLIIA